MTDSIETRVIEEARYIIRHRCTVRACAAVFGVGKSTVHTDLHCRLKEADVDLYEQVCEIETYNFNVKHLRGGESTRKRYAKRKKDACAASDITV